MELFPLQFSEVYNSFLSDVYHRKPDGGYIVCLLCLRVFLINPYPSTIFVLKMLSAFTSAASSLKTNLSIEANSSACQTRFFHRSKQYEPNSI